MLLLLLLSEAQQHKRNFCSIKLRDKNKIKEGLTAVLYLCTLKLEPEIYRRPLPPPMEGNLQIKMSPAEMTIIIHTQAHIYIKCIYTHAHVPIYKPQICLPLFLLMPRVHSSPLQQHLHIYRRNKEKDAWYTRRSLSSAIQRKKN